MNQCSTIGSAVRLAAAVSSSLQPRRCHCSASSRHPPVLPVARSSWTLPQPGLSRAELCCAWMSLRSAGCTDRCHTAELFLRLLCQGWQVAAPVTLSCSSAHLSLRRHHVYVPGQAPEQRAAVSRLQPGLRLLQLRHRHVSAAQHARQQRSSRAAAAADGVCCHLPAASASTTATRSRRPSSATSTRAASAAWRCCSAATYWRWWEEDATRATRPTR